MTITLHNDFHNTSADVRVVSLPHTITPGQYRRLKATLCGATGCECGIIRGPQVGPDGQRLHVDYDYDADLDERGRLPLRIAERAANERNAQIARRQGAKKEGQSGAN